MRRTGDSTLRFAKVSACPFYWRNVITPYPWPAAALLLLMMASATLDAVTVGLTVPLLDAMTDPARVLQGPVGTVTQMVLQTWRWPPHANVVVFALLVVASVFFVLRSGCLLLTQYAMVAIAVRLRRRAKGALLDKFLHARYEDVSARSRGNIVNDINRPADALVGVMMQLGYLVTGILTSGVLIVLLLYLSWWATVLIGVVAVGGVQGWRWYADRRSAVYGRTLYDLQGEQHKLQMDAIDGLKIVKSYALEPQIIQRQDTLLAAEYRPELQLALFRHGPTVVNELVAVFMILGLGAVTFLLPSAGLRFSMLGAFLLAIRRIAPSLAMVNQASVNLHKYQRDLEVIEGVLAALPQERRGGRVPGRIETLYCQQLTFWYTARPECPALHEVEVMMRRGTVTAVVGPTGSGKSTLANLLLGLYEPRGGTVWVNGADLHTLDLVAWRRQIGYVPQDVFIFNATIHDNLTLGDATVSPTQVQWAARVAQLEEFIASLPEQYQTVVGDRGLRLSGGQCQRLAIARAILRQPQVLVFDEATSALDALTERAVYEAIDTLRREAMVLVIAHRLTTVKHADQILVLDHGRAVERGVHDTLVRQGGLYGRLYEAPQDIVETGHAHLG